jgi:subtilase family serine protease
MLALSGSRLTAVAHAAPGARPVGPAPALPRGAARLGPLAPATQLTVDIALKPRRAVALADYARAVSRATSSQYRRYLTVPQLRRRFGPSTATIRAVKADLTRGGLRPARVSANGLLIRIRASAAGLDAALGVALERVRLAGGRVAYLNRRAPRFGVRVADLIQGVVGLEDLVTPRPLSLAPTASTGEAPTATSSCGVGSLAAGAGAYTPDEIASAYGFDSLYGAGDYGAGETVALMEYEPYATSDIDAFENCFAVNGDPIGGGDAADVQEIDVDGGAGAQGPDGQYGSGESALDIEEVLSVAPDATVDVYETSDTGSDATTLDAYNAMIENATVDAISTSWGECETALSESDPAFAAEENAIFEEAAAAGISVFAASGDTGSTACQGELSGHAGDAAAVEDPSSQPYVTSVGGTSLPSASDPAAQTVWNDSLGAGGGGVSTLWKMPSYQSAAAATLPGVLSLLASGSACGATLGSDCRETPDVSADADPDTGYLIYWDGGWQAFGGTSAAAPLWAGLIALADGSSACAGRTIGFANPVLYGIAANPTEYADDFTDVTSGDNALLSELGGLFGATPGYDMATGLGTPKAATLVPDMCSEAATLGTSRTRATSPTSWPTSSTPTTPPVTTAPPTSPAPPSTPQTTPVTSPTPASPVVASTCTLTQSLHPATAALSLSRAHPRASLSVAFSEPDTTACHSYSLTLQRHIATTERGAARARDLLTIQLLNHAGKLVKTLATLSGAQARAGEQTMTLKLSAEPGQRLTLRFLATRGGTQTTAFTLRALTLQST